ncbi:hypothetical protein HY995_04310 [Candidatus Micrarchaeota archaeon]|nr:hypothetical protein [Candidatus Micrarchaeota archaeon]
MAFAALEALEPAIEKTRDFFSGPGLGRKWLKIALIVWLSGVMVGGTVGLPNFGSGNRLFPPDSANFTAAAANSTARQFSNNLGAATPLLISAIALIVALALALILVRSVYIFVLFESLERNEPQILGYLSKFFAKGAMLFLARIALGILALLGVGGLLVSAIGIAGNLLHSAGATPQMGLGESIAIFAASLVILLALAVANWIQESVAVLIMYRNDRGLAQGWKESVELIRKEPLEIAVFVAVGIGISIAISIAAMILLIAYLVPLIFVILLFAFLLAAVGLANPVLLAVITALALAVALFFIILYLALNAPLSVFHAEYLLQFYRLILGKKERK